MSGTAQAEILRIRRENLAAERAEKARKGNAKLAEKKQLYDRLQAIVGLWKTSDAVNEGLEKLKLGICAEQKALLEVGKTQISFCKKNLSNEIPKLSCFSQDKKPFSLKEMTQRLKQIVQLKQADSRSKSVYTLRHSAFFTDVFYIPQRFNEFIQ